MKCTIPEISWHNREPVLTVDIHPENANFYRLATGGADSHVLIWQMNIAKNGAVSQEVISDLNRHQKAVNCVRWSHSGKYLASGDDDANIIIWQLKTDNIPSLDGETGDKETWNVYKVLRGHKEDVYDICWSIDDTKLLTGSVDNTAILWDLNRGNLDHILTDHKGFVQGVAWDPKNQFVATVGTDRICRIFDCTGKQVKARLHKGKIVSVPENHVLKDKEVKYFHDDTFKSFFRRLAFSPDGSLLVVPSGHLEIEDCKTIINATLVFTLDNFSYPAAILPIPKQSSTTVRFCPLLFELRENGPEATIKLPYRMVFAVGTDHDVLLYDTQQTFPIGRFQDIHYTRITDLTWSQDGCLLVAASTDGFCSLITFEKDELGFQWMPPEVAVQESVTDVSDCKVLTDKVENLMETSQDEPKKKKKEAKQAEEPVKRKPSFLEQWASKTPQKKKKLEGELSRDEKQHRDINDSKTEEKGKKIGDMEVIEVHDSPSKLDNSVVIEIHDSPVKNDSAMHVENRSKNVQDSSVSNRAPRRIVPIKIAEVDNNKTVSKSATASTDKPTLSSVLENSEIKNSIRRIKPIRLDSTSSPQNTDATSINSANRAPINVSSVTHNTEVKDSAPRRIKPILLQSPKTQGTSRKKNLSGD